MTASSLSDFQRNAADKIRHIGGSIFYASNKSWTNLGGERISVLNPDRRTEGFIGWPTITALMQAEILYLRRGNEYALTGKA